jgi:ABC-type sugar transport system permease subunit
MTSTAVARPPTENDRDGPRPAGKPGRTVEAAAFLFPAVAVVAVVLLVPFVVTVVRSFRSNDLSESFAGIDNYTAMLSTPEVTRSLLNTLIWVAGSLVLPVGLGLAVAVLTNSVRWGPVARLFIVLPYAISGAAVAVVGGFLLRSDGAVNQALRAVGLDSWARNWLLEWPLNVFSAIGVSTWQSTGVAVVLFLVGLQTIPPETMEAARIDGAGGWVLFRRIVVPQLRPVTAVVVGITLANALKTFDMIWVLTQGGPARSSETLAISMYRESFLLQRVGTGSAIAVVLSVVVVAASWVYLRSERTVA